ncbi:MAG: hypothetical protein ABIO48_15710 [Pedococcus sp.]
MAEFDDLFTTHLQHLDWEGPATLILQLTGPDGLADMVRDLAARESSCCSFFDFTTTLAAGTDTPEVVELRVSVPTGREDVLAAVAARAAAAIPS